MAQSTRPGGVLAEASDLCKEEDVSRKDHSLGYDGFKVHGGVSNVRSAEGATVLPANLGVWIASWRKSGCLTVGENADGARLIDIEGNFLHPIALNRPQDDWRVERDRVEGIRPHRSRAALGAAYGHPGNASGK